MFQLIQLGFSRSLGSATSSEANKSAMRRAEWTIAARRAVLRLAQIKYRYFVWERCKQNAIFSGTSHQNKAYLDNISTNRWYIVGFMQGHCSSKVTDENFKISSPILQTLTPKFHSNSVSALCKERYQWIASKMHGLVTLQNRRCKNRPSHFARISVSLTDSESPKFIKYFRRLEDCQFSVGLS